jgi:hypothetical protein
MKSTVLMVIIESDEENPLLPTDADMVLAVQDALNQPDNDNAGIKKVTVWVGSAQPDR